LDVENCFRYCWIEGVTNLDVCVCNWHFRHVHGRLFRSLPACGRAILIAAVASEGTANCDNGSPTKVKNAR